ncbi:MAG TPA: 4-oxalocrotonate tautomerase family protein [Solirubrobacterales bacterium]
MPFVQIHWFEGRDDEQKAEIARRVTEAMVETGKAKPEDVWVKFEDVALADWYFGGERKK